jgi:hypothetical protein
MVYQLVPIQKRLFSGWTPVRAGRSTGAVRTAKCRSEVRQYTNNAKCQMVDALRAVIYGVLVCQGAFHTARLTKQAHGLTDKRNIYKWLPSSIWYLGFDIWHSRLLLCPVT